MLRIVLYILIALAWITYLMVAIRGGDDEDDPGPRTLNLSFKG